MNNRENSLIIIVIIFVVLFLLFESFGMFGFPNLGYGMMSGFYAGSGMMFFAGLVYLLIIVALVLFIIWLVKQIGGKK